jgi:hypothetical protein
MEHTRARALSPPGPPWPTRVCRRPIRDGRGGFAATLALCAQLASGHHVTPAPVPFCLFSAPPRSRPSRAAPGPRRPRPPTGPAAALPLLRAAPPPAAPPPRGRPPARESAALAGGASSGAAEPTVAPSRGPCSGPRRHARTPHAHRLPCSPLRLSGRLPGRTRFASTQTLRPPSGVRTSCNPSLSQKPPEGTRFTTAVVRARSSSHTTWAAFLTQDGDGVKFLVKSHVEPRAVPIALPAASPPPRGPRQCRQLIPALEMEDPRGNGDRHGLGTDQLAR